MGPLEWVTPRQYYTFCFVQVARCFASGTGDADSDAPKGKSCKRAVAIWADTKKRSALAGICRLKSARLSTSKPQQPTKPERFRAAPNDCPNSRSPRMDSTNRTAKNQVQQSAPERPVSANASR